MKKMTTALFAIMMGMSLLFGVTASANPSIVSYGVTYTNTLTAGDGYTYLLPNAKTTGTSIKITASAANALQLHYFWSYNNTSVDLGTAIVNSTSYSGGSGYYEAGTLVVVVERVADSNAAYPSVSYTITFN